MALNFTVSYTFSPSTTISSSQVNTNTSDVANVFNGLEAETKTLAKLKVDIDPTAALEVATKQYVDHYSTYRRPVLQYSSSTVVNLEAGINGTSGQATILFPDGNLRTDSTSSRINLDISRTAAIAGSAQSGVDSVVAPAGTTRWFAVYAVKVTDNSSNFVTVATDKSPTQSSFTTLNTRFGAQSWVYLGLIRYGDSGGVTNVILKFFQAGNTTIFYNANNGGNYFAPAQGILMGTTAGATTLTYTYAAGTTGTNVPDNVTHGIFSAGGTTLQTLKDAANSVIYTNLTAAAITFQITVPIAQGLRLAQSGSNTADIYLAGYIDGALGVGSNPLL